MFARIVIAAGIAAVAALGLATGNAVSEAHKKSVCEASGYIYSPVRPDGDVFVCWAK